MSDPARYTIEEHLHRFAAWAASRAATVKGSRFAVEHGKEILEAIRVGEGGLRDLIGKPDQLPSPADIDACHRHWRRDLIAAAKIPLTHGVAAKLINVYLKAAFVCAGHHDHPHVRALHPPIDRILLKNLKNGEGSEIRRFKTDWKKAHHHGWSNFDSNDYERVIDRIRDVMGSRPLWEIEAYWDGHQSLVGSRHLEKAAS